MGLHSKWESGELVFYDGATKLISIPKNDLQEKFIEVPSIIGMNQKVAYEFFEDFLQSDAASAGTMSGWTVTLVEAGAGDTTLGLSTSDVGGVLVITADANEDDGANCQLNGEAFKLATGKKAYFGARVKLSEATQSDMLVGLCITDTTLLGGMTDGVYFRKVDGSTDVKFVTEKNSTETESAAILTAANDIWATLEFYFDGDSTVKAYVNGTLAATHTANICDDENLTPSVAFLSGAAGAGKTMSVDWIRTVQLR